MKINKLSINNICILCSVLFFLGAALTIFGFCVISDYVLAIRIEVLFLIFVIGIDVFFVMKVREKLLNFTERICICLDNMISGKEKSFQSIDEDTIFYKINYRLERLYDVIKDSNNSILKERADLQELVSDISHQVKTPIANLKIINSTLLEQSLSENKQKEFLSASIGQLDKLDFLMQALVKTSRLETGVISLNKEKQFFYETLALALGDIYLNAEKKKLKVFVDCPEKIEISHDRKWIREALFNILDNAVKYTPQGGNICVKVLPWQLYLRIDITDSGKGISENQQNLIFKRFYREAEVHDIEGIGIGLYLARKIIMMQEGYIKVSSQVDQGSKFSVFLPYDNN